MLDHLRGCIQRVRGQQRAREGAVASVVAVQGEVTSEIRRLCHKLTARFLIELSYRLTSLAWHRYAMLGTYVNSEHQNLHLL